MLFAPPVEEPDPPDGGVVVELLLLAGGAVEVEVEAGVETEVVSVVDVPAAVPGRHWEYQSLEYLQTAPATQVVGPVKPIPPPSPSKIRF
jgi:hypothetical protein